jgi:PhnB protein
VTSRSKAGQSAAADHKLLPEFYLTVGWQDRNSFSLEAAMHINPYLMFDGRCEEAFKLYERVTGGKILAMLTHEGTPAESQVPPEWQKKILHARLQIGGDQLMGSDAPPGRYQGSNGYSVTLRVDTPEEAERVFNGLAEGATIQMPLDRTFFAQKFGMLADKFGIPWMVICENPK